MITDQQCDAIDFVVRREEMHILYVVGPQVPCLMCRMLLCPDQSSSAFKSTEMMSNTRIASPGPCAYGTHRYELFGNAMPV